MAPSAQRRLATAGWPSAKPRSCLGDFHVVFTLPHEFSALALQNKKLIYGLLFRASAETLLEVAANPEHLGAAIGFLSILHSEWRSLSGASLAPETDALDTFARMKMDSAS